MKIGVCIKSTPDADTRIKIAAGASGIDTAGIKWVVSDYEKAAIESAVQTKEKNPGSEVVLYSVGSAETEKNLRDGLAVGGDRAVLIDDPALKATDSLGIARALAAAIKADGLDLVFCGRQATDLENVQVPAMLAELLDWPHVSIAIAFAAEGTDFVASRNMGGVTEKVRGAFPVVVSAEDTLAVPRYVKLPDIMKAKSKKLDKKNLAALGLAATDVAPATVLSAYALPPARPAGRKLTGDAATQVKELVRLLREEAKVI